MSASNPETRALYTRLQEVLGDRHAETLMTYLPVEPGNQLATKSDMEKYFEGWLKNNVDANSSLFVYFSGHGAPKAETGEAYIVPVDAGTAGEDGNIQQFDIGPRSLAARRLMPRRNAQGRFGCHCYLLFNDNLQREVSLRPFTGGKVHLQFI